MTKFYHRWWPTVCMIFVFTFLLFLIIPNKVLGQTARPVTHDDVSLCILVLRVMFMGLVMGLVLWLFIRALRDDYRKALNREPPVVITTLGNLTHRPNIPPRTGPAKQVLNEDARRRAREQFRT